MTAGLIPASADLDALTDPSNRIILSMDRAKAWLAEALAGDQIEQIVEIKSQAEAIRVYAIHKQLGYDAELSASEVVRRAERCIGLAIRKGQETGRIKKRGADVADAYSVVDAASGMTRNELSDVYPMVDGVSPEQFESALSEAKAERNLSRANVVRKTKGESGSVDRWALLAELAADGHSSSQIAKRLGFTPEVVARKAKKLGIEIQADRVLGHSRHLNHTRMLRTFMETLESLVPSCEMIDLCAVDPAVLKESRVLLSTALRELRKFERTLREKS